ncbi:MAG: PDZ domain-containing protein [Planctomycetes bacterium]|nr:PDZ domain-containing protein [Planctomycetota bacterium]
MADLLDRFVCVRLVQANGMDLSLFQFDYRQTWAVFFLNADQVIYGRYGCRADVQNQRKATDEDQNVSIEGLRKAMEGALALHADYPADKAVLAGKRGPAPRFARPELYPALSRFGPRLRPDGKGCMHCHQVYKAERQEFKDAKLPLPPRLTAPYPMPDVLGLVLDRKERAKVASVTPDSSAARDGFLAGDELRTLAGQPLLSIADVQWVLQNAEEPGRLKAEVLRDGKQLQLTLSVPEGWRQAK